MPRRFPRSLRRFLRRITEFFEQLHFPTNRYSSRTQFRPRTMPGNLLTTRTTPERGVYNRPRPSRQRYTASEIKAFLQGSLQTDRDRFHNIANQFQIGRLSEILNRPIPKRFHGREWLYSRLVTVTTRYSQKVPPAEIAESLSLFYKAEDVEEAIDYVATMVAESLNKPNSAWF